MFGSDEITAPWMTEEVTMVRETAKRFFAQEFTPNIDKWRKQGVIDRWIWKAAGDLGLLAASLPKEFGGSASRILMAMVILEQGRTGDASWGISVQNYVSHYIEAYGTQDQKARWLPKLGNGEWIAAIAMTEPGAGSDLKTLNATAVRRDGGFLINGQKTFITNGQTADLVCVAARTEPSAGAKGISLLMVETADAPGFRRGRKLDKIGLHAADTSELFFDDVWVPETNLLGMEPGKGFGQLMTQLHWERLTIAIRSLGQAEFAFRGTLRHTRERKMFGGTLFDLQNTQFKLAEMAAKIEAMRAMVYANLELLDKGKLTATRSAMAKLFCSEALNWVVDECVQLHGSYGFMDEYAIARLYADARITRIYGGSNEIMKLLIARGFSET